MPDARPWYMALWAMADSSMRRWSEALQKIVRTLRLVRVLLIVGILAIFSSAAIGVLAGLGYIQVKWFLFAYAIAALFLVIPLAALVALVALPLRLRSVTRLVDMGYPANAREIAIRLMARKLRDESIETEELLVETAVNETRKVLRRMEERRRANQASDDAAAAPQPPPPPASPPSPPSTP